MIFRWSRMHSIILIGSLLLVILIAFFSFYQYIYPRQQELEHLQLKLAEQDILIENADQNSQEIEDEVASSLNLQKQLPIDKAVNQLILNFEEIEKITNTTITLMTKSEDQLSNSKSEEATPDLKKINYQLNVISTNYDDMNQFLVELNNMDRLVEINNIEFTQINVENFELSIGVTAFYNPSLTALQIESPAFEYNQQEEDQD
ncbi:hypothetical protein GCM10011351_11420 [Paraliobacillus quinghaiensis]|uniref:Pilus assembly protein PilO n=1 Tax=Paraliobacillus quinghaiensis TaxID=470815 RepID=A0A917WTH1_9BACI|nr:type 4a pilus biogenesis protein PilO [Paraliobacillus quinghaiensis]GGM27313.1 hypothetical protein GCM10011351_11420 [Paraliobacillus quinghaiensis]